MRWLLLWMVPALLFAQGGAPVEGTVISRVTHAGIAGVTVTVESVNGPHVTYSATTAQDGTFHILVDGDGEFKAHYSAPRYQDETPARATFRVAGNGPVKLRAEMTLLNSLRGRVVDPDGRPVPQADVQILGTRGNWILDVETDKDGSFAFQGTPPSRVFLMRAVAKGSMWAPTFYPSTAELAQSLPITWRGEGDLEGYEIKLCAVPVFHVRGTVLDETGEPVEGASVKLLRAGESLPVLRSMENPDASTTSGKDGLFELSAVRPGDWLLDARWKRGDRQMRGVAASRVSDGDWKDAKVRLAPPFSVKGTLEAPASGTARGGVELVPADESTLQGASGSVGSDGRFEITNVYAGRYRIVLRGMENRFYLDSLQLGGQEVLGQTVAIVNGSLPIRAVYQANSGRVQGTAEHCLVVSVIPKDVTLRDSQFSRNTRCNARGHFEVGGLRPGDYYAVALAAPEFKSAEQALDELLFDPEGLGGEEIVRLAETVRVEGGQSTTVTLRLTPWPE